MFESAEIVLKKTLSQLVAQREKTDKEIKAVQTALAAIGVASPNLAKRRKRKSMTAAERKLVSKRMKTYWAKRRAKSAT
jgi:hypothetical protein